MIPLLLFLAAGFACNKDVVTTNSTEPLIVYAAKREQLVTSILDQFTESTGIEVKVKYGGTAQIVATLLEENNNSPADIFWTRDPGGLGILSSLLKPIPQDILLLVPPWARSTRNNWVGISARVRSVVYNSDRVSHKQLPNSIWDFTNPVWGGRIGWSPTSGPTQTMITSMRVLWGEEKTRRWITKLQANKPIIYNNHTSVVTAAAAGEIDVGFVNHYYVHRLREERKGAFPVQNYFFRHGGPGNLTMISGAAILKTTKRHQEAESFLRFLLSEPAQEYFTLRSFEYPVIPGISPNPDLTPFSAIERPEIDMDSLYNLEDSIFMLRDLGVLP